MLIAEPMLPIARLSVSLSVGWFSFMSEVCCSLSGALIYWPLHHHQLHRPLVVITVSDVLFTVHFCLQLNLITPGWSEDLPPGELALSPSLFLDFSVWQIGSSDQQRELKFFESPNGLVE